MILKKINICLVLLTIICFSCKQESPKQASNASPELPFDWNGANLYFMLLDRFNNGDTSNDTIINRTNNAATFRAFEGGDLKGITQKINEGYFTELGINVIWFTPVNEQIHGYSDEGTGKTYAYHGYWIKDWTNIDPNFGTKQDLKDLVQAAHSKGIRVLLDAIINHRGPVTEQDPNWPTDWVRTEPPCTYKDFSTAVDCTLVENLPDILTNSNQDVELPPQLVEKWKAEGRYEQEIKELDEFFATTGYPKAPKYYIIKWLTDYIREFGIDGYRVDTVKHVEPEVWQAFKTECDRAFAQYQQNNNTLNSEFFLLGELYGYGISGGLYYEFPDKKINYFDRAFDHMINFEFKYSAKQMDYESMFVMYDSILQSDLKTYGVTNYLTSHDDAEPFDRTRENTIEAGTRLLLAPGMAQIYYGDETARTLKYDSIKHDADLRSFMNWNQLEESLPKATLAHYQKLGKFRAKHPAIGAGKHQIITKQPYLFKRTYQKNELVDEVVIGLNLPKGKKQINNLPFANGTKLLEAYSQQEVHVTDSAIELNSDYDIVLLEKI